MANYAWDSLHKEVSALLLEQRAYAASPSVAKKVQLINQQMVVANKLYHLAYNQEAVQKLAALLAGN